MNGLNNEATGDPSVNSRVIYTVGHNMPGYMPEGDVWSFDTFEEAKASLRDDLDRAADSLADQEFPSTPEAQGNDELTAYESAVEELDKAIGPDFLAYADGMAWWIDSHEVTESEYNELKEWQDGQ